MDSNNFSVPWNQETVLGWVGIIAATTVTAVVLFSLSGTFLSLFVSFYEHHKAFLLIFVDLITTLNREVEKQDRCAMKLVLCNLLKYNIIGKE